MKTLLIVLIFCSSALSAVTNGQKAPLFKLKNHIAEEINLKSFQGKIVILEWTNKSCPFVKKHYDSGNMQRLQKIAKQQNTIWLSIVSSAPGKQGHITQSEALSTYKEKGFQSHAILMDTNGAVGKKYGALTTPHMFVIDTNGNIIYQGAIDSIASADPRDIPKSKNYVEEILKDLKNGKTLKPFKTRPYGCSVKY